VRILTETDASLTDQYRALLATGRCYHRIRCDGVRRIAEVSWEVNERTENIGARRACTPYWNACWNRSLRAADRSGQSLLIDAAYVDEHVARLAKDEDLSRIYFNAVASGGWRVRGSQIRMPFYLLLRYSLLATDL